MSAVRKYTSDVVEQTTAQRNAEDARRDIEVIRPMRKRFAGVKIVLSAAAIGALLFTVISAKLDENTLYNSIAAENTEYEYLLGENARMQSELQSRTSYKNIQEYAEQILGLKKIDRMQLEYITIQDGNAVEIPDNEPDFFTYLKNKFDAIMEYFAG